MTNSINPAPTLQREARLWLAGIRRRIGARGASETHIYLLSLSCFNNRKNCSGLYGFVELCCFHSDIKKAIVIYFTSMRFVNELFALLSGLSSKDVVPGYFE